MKTKATSVEKYVSSLSKDTKLRINSIRRIAYKVSPNFSEKISYGIISFRIKEKAVFYIAGFSKHVGMYPFIDTNLFLDRKISNYKHGKATLRFLNDDKLPLNLIKNLIKYKVKKHEEK